METKADARGHPVTEELTPAEQALVGLLDDGVTKGDDYWKPTVGAVRQALAIIRRLCAELQVAKREREEWHNAATKWEEVAASRHPAALATEPISTKACLLCGQWHAASEQCPAPPAAVAPGVAVAGGLTTSLADFERRCDGLLVEEQMKIAPDNSLISVLCDAVRMSREYAESMRPCALSPAAVEPKACRWRWLDTGLRLQGGGTLHGIWGAGCDKAFTLMPSSMLCPGCGGRIVVEGA